MASVNFANSNSGPLAASIGWFDFTGVNLIANASLNLANSLPNGGNISFTITNTNSQGVAFTGSVAPVYSGIAFGTTNYTGIAGKPLLSGDNFANALITLTINNLNVTNSLGATIPYGLVVAEGEGQASNEIWRWTTNGTPWNLIANIHGNSALISGTGTQTVQWGNATGLPDYPSPVFSTNSPTQIVGFERQNSQSAIGLGVILTPITIRKNVTNRITSSDQFNLSITGPQSATTVTSGIATGIQTQNASLFAQDGGTYIINESMASGSGSSLSQYAVTTSIVNNAQGGTNIPAGWTIGTPLTVAMGDNISVIVTNTPINPSISSVKTVSESFGTTGDILDYTIVLTNTSPNVAINTKFIDTIPTGTTFIPASLKVNNVATAGNPNPPSGLTLATLPANSVTTITYQVSVNSGTTVITPIKNSSTTNYSYLVVSNTVPSVFSNSNIVTTTISSVILSSNKIVNKNYANIGDILTYTIPISNTGNVTANSIVFIDTIPGGTSLVSNSFKQDSTPIAGTPNAPGVTLPNSLRPGGITTVTFQLIVTTIPTINPIPNTATASSSFTIDSTITPSRIGASGTNTNVVNTQINNASLGGITKITDKSFVDCGDIINYTIIIPNNGNVTALNVIFTDTIPTGTSFVANSVFINNVQQTGANPGTGIAVPNIEPGATTTITFQVRVTC